MEDLPFPLDGDIQVFRQGVDDRSPDPVQTAGVLVAPVSELAARVKNRENQLHCGLSGLVIDAGRNAAAIVGHGDAAVLMNRDFDVGTETRQGFIHRIVHNFIDQVMKASRVLGPDIHTEALTDILRELELLDGIRPVFRFGLPYFFFCRHCDSL